MFLQTGKVFLSHSLSLSLQMHVNNAKDRRMMIFSCAEWQIYLLLVGLFLASAVAFYIFFKNSDSFWNFPLTRQQQRPKMDSFLGDAQSEDQNAFGPLDM